MMFCRVVRQVVALVCVCGVIEAQPAAVWLDVPFVEQQKDGCGAATIAMVMQYWLKQQGRLMDESADAKLIQRELYEPTARGTYASAMERYFQQHGFQTFSFSGEWKDLRQHIQKGRPLIVALKPSGAEASLHYVVVAGIDWEQDILLLNDPAQRKLLKQRRSAVEEQWSATGKWTLLALPQSARR